MSSKSSKDEIQSDGFICRSIALKLIRHAESRNNEVYRKARVLFKGGTSDFDLDGWNEYVDEHRVADPGISDKGHEQAHRLAQYLAPHLINQASKPVQIISSPMRRTLETVMPTLSALQQSKSNNDNVSPFSVLVNAFYFETEGCHFRDVPEPGMNQHEIREFLGPSVHDDQHTIDFEGFSNDPSHGWYEHGTAPETRSQSESRAAKFYFWLCEHLDKQLESDDHDVFDAGVTLPSEKNEKEFDKMSPRKRKRRTAILIGHGDFMSLLLKRIVAGFGHSVENEGIPHRSGLVHYNTGITELEYFGKGRFLVMGTNQTPHLNHVTDLDLLSGGGLKDGWAYIMPPDKHIMDETGHAELEVDMDDHLKEQTEALKNLYAYRRRSSDLSTEDNKNALSVQEINGAFIRMNSNGNEVSILVKRGLEVVACASLNDQTGFLTDVVVRPSAKKGKAWKILVEEAKQFTLKTLENKVLRVQVDTDEEESFYRENGFLIDEFQQIGLTNKYMIWEG